jgi:hypothetical protein
MGIKTTQFPKRPENFHRIAHENSQSTTVLKVKRTRNIIVGSQYSLIA